MWSKVQWAVEQRFKSFVFIKTKKCHITFFKCLFASVCCMLLNFWSGKALHCRRPTVQRSCLPGSSELLSPQFGTSPCRQLPAPAEAHLADTLWNLPAGVQQAIAAALTFLANHTSPGRLSLGRPNQASLQITMSLK